MLMSEPTQITKTFVTDLDAALEIARIMAKRNDPAAHLLQVEAE